MAALTANEVQRKARYGRRDWVLWKDKDGTRHTEPVSAASLKAAGVSLKRIRKGRHQWLECYSVEVA